MDGAERQPRPSDSNSERELRLARLAELMVHITECSPAVAIGAVARAAGDDPINNDNAIDILARAISSVRSGIDLRDSVNLREEIQQLETVRPNS